MIPLVYSTRNLVVRKQTTLATIGGLSLVVFVFASVLMLSNSIEKTMARAADPDVAVVLRKGSEGELSSSLDESSVGTILSRAEVTHGRDGAPLGVGEVVAVVQAAREGAPGAANVQIRGVPDNVLAFRPEVKVIAGRLPRPGTNEVMVGRAIQGRLVGLGLGQTFSLKKNRPVQVVGVFAAEGSSLESEVWADLHTTQGAFGREALVSSVRVKLSPSAFDAFRTSIEADRVLNVSAVRESEYYQKQSQSTALLIGVLGTIVSVFFAAGAVLAAMITMHASVANRRRELGTLRALGFSKASIVMAVLLEGLLLALAAGAVGGAASLGLSAVRFSILNAASWSEIVFTFEPTAGILVASIALAGAVGLMGALLPAMQAARLDLSQAMRA